jgi:molybdopterin molybdotransferase
MLRGLLEKGDFGDNRGDARGPVKPIWWDARWVPLLHNESGDYECADLDPPEGGRVGQIVVFRHVAARREVVADGLRALLGRFADDLEAGSYAVEEGALVRRQE